MITKFSNLNKEVAINISEEFPIKLTYNLDDWKDKEDEEDEDDEENNNIDNYISFYLAPLLEDE